MIIAFDKRVDSNIVSITGDDATDGDVFYWSSQTSGGWVINYRTGRIRIGNDGVTIDFSSGEAIKPYIEQREILMAHNIHYPSVKINRDPYYDLPKTGSIISHQYTYTDVEHDKK